MSEQHPSLPDEPMFPLTSDLVLNGYTGELIEGGEVVACLRPTEARVLQCLLEHEGRVVPYDFLSLSTYPNEGYSPEPWFYKMNTERVQRVVSRLRAGLREVSEELSGRIATFDKRGYRWDMLERLDQLEIDLEID